jgi:hypothetical protein
MFWPRVLAYLNLDSRFSFLGRKSILGRDAVPSVALRVNRGAKALYGLRHPPHAMLPQDVDRRDGMLVLRAVFRIKSLTTTDGAVGRVTMPEVMDALRRMDRPEDFWDIAFKLVDQRLLEISHMPHGDVRFTVVEVQSHDVGVFLHQNRKEIDAYDAKIKDEAVLTRSYLDGLEDARARAVFL